MEINILCFVVFVVFLVLQRFRIIRQIGLNHDNPTMLNLFEKSILSNMSFNVVVYKS